MRHMMSVSIVVAVAATLSACGVDEPEWSDDPCDPNYPYTGWGTIIGPEGGVAGDLIRLVVPPGAWAECWVVDVEGNFGSWLVPDFPVGFVPSQSIKIAIYRHTEYGQLTFAPDSMYFELLFPLSSIPPQSRQFLAAFFYDDTAADWRVQLPDELDTDYLTVRASNWKQQWWFGQLDLAEIDFERYLTPVLADRLGTDAWNQIQEAVDSIYELAVRGMSWPIDCGGLESLETVFERLMESAAANLRAIQAEIYCGTCDVLTSVFWDQWTQDVRQKQGALFVEFFLGLVPGNQLLAKLTGEAMLIGLQLTASQFACDYDCFWESIPLNFYWYLGEYGLSAAIIYLTQWYRTSGYIDCAPGWSGDPLPGGWPNATSTLGTGAVNMCPGGLR